jgi:pilus assembly protein FimV
VKNPEEILQEYPDSIVFARVAELLAGRGELDSARDILDTGITQHPGYAPGYAVRASICASTGDLDGALEALDSAIALDPQSPADILRLAQLYVDMDRQDDAETAFRAVERFEPDARKFTGTQQEDREDALAADDTTADTTVDTTAETAAVPLVEYAASEMDKTMSDAVAELLAVSDEPDESIEPVASETDEDMEPVDIVTMDMVDDSHESAPVEADDTTDDISDEITEDTVEEIAEEIAEETTDDAVEKTAEPVDEAFAELFAEDVSDTTDDVTDEVPTYTTDEDDADTLVESTPSAEPADPVESELPEIEDITPEQEPESPVTTDEVVEAADVSEDFVATPEDTLPVVGEAEDSTFVADDTSLTIAPQVSEPVMEVQDTQLSEPVMDVQDTQDMDVATEADAVSEPAGEPVEAPVDAPADTGVAESDDVEQKPSDEIDLSWLDEESDSDPMLSDAAADTDSVAKGDVVIDLDGLDESESDYAAMLKDVGVTAAEPMVDDASDSTEDETADGQPTVDDEIVLEVEESSEVLGYEAALKGAEEVSSAPEETESVAPAEVDDVILEAEKGDETDDSDVVEHEEPVMDGSYVDLSAEEIDVLSDSAPVTDVGELVLDENEGLDYSDVLAGYGASTVKDDSDDIGAKSEETAEVIDTSTELPPYGATDVTADEDQAPSTEPSPWEVAAESEAETDPESIRVIEDLIRSTPDVPSMDEDELPESPPAAPEPESSVDSDDSVVEINVPEAAPDNATPEIETAPSSDTASDGPSLDDLINRYEKTIDAAGPSEQSESSDPIGEMSDCTVTMAEIYVAQGLISKAMDIYTVLAERDPDNDLLGSRLEALRSMRDERADES